MGGFEQADIHRIKEMIGHQDVIIVDIRDESSFTEGHIPNAILLTNQNITEFLDTADKEKSLICYCYHGVSSQRVAEFLSDNGFGKVYSIIGGFEEWRNSYPDEIVYG